MTAARIRALVPDTAFKPNWSSATFLFYAGTLVMFGSILWVLGEANGEGDDFGLVGWTTLGLAALVIATVFLQRGALTVLAGLAAFLSLIVFAVWVGAVEDWLGVFPDSVPFFHDDFEPGLLVLELLVIAAGLYAVRWLRFPFLVLPVASLAWYAIADNLSNLDPNPGTDMHAFCAIVGGVAVAGAGVWLDRSGRSSYGLWPHVVGGVAAGAGLIELLDHHWRWWLLGAISLLYVAAAPVLARSSYAVLGAAGIFWVGSHFIETWYSTPGLPFLIFEPEGSEPVSWKGPLSYVVLGLIIVMLGLLVERGRRPRTAP